MENEEPRLFCQRCVARAAGDEWETKEDSDQPRVDYLSREWWVFCYGCDREIEFGWSLPDRGGRIWPAEYTDFKPLGCWPDPRYVVSWAKKGWSR